MACHDLPDAGSMSSPKASISFAHKHDEAQSRDRTPELGSGDLYYDARDAEETEVEPPIENQTVKTLYQTEHTNNTSRPQMKKKKK